MPAATLTSQVTIAGLTITGRTERTAAQQISDESAELPAAKAGSLTTRTDDNTGVATLSTGHGIATSDVVDVYWDGGRRYGMTATVATNAVTVDGGAGDNLPTANTAVTVSKQVELNLDFAGDSVEMFACYATRRCSVAWQQENGTAIAAKDLTANEPYVYASGRGDTNLFAGVTVGQVKVSNGDSAGTCILRQAVLYDSAS